VPSLEPPRYQIGSSPIDETSLDRMAEFRGDARLMSALWSAPSARALVVHSGRALLDGAGLALLPTAEAPAGERFLLGVAAQGPVFAVHPSSVLTDDRARGIRSAAGRLRPDHLGLFMHAVALSAWHENNPRCPRCGSVTDVIAAGYARRCRQDGSEHHPRTDPAVIVLVTDGSEAQVEQCLLGRQASWPEGRFSTLAGFVEPGETVEEAVAREVAEEVGVEVASVSYAGSQPWPFPASLMLAYYAVAAEGQTSQADVTVDGEEIVEARWFSRAQLRMATEAGEVLVPPGLSVARRLIEGWMGAPISQAGTWR
jgi:NAD+ diphosphatase